MTDYSENLFQGANPKQFEFGRTLRQETTFAEALMWGKLRSRRFMNLKFRRQHPINKYIADFYCHEFMLVIEIDGGIHNLKINQEYDLGRTTELEQHGISVLRFTNEEVIHEMEDVLEKIRNYVASLRPHPKNHSLL